MVKPNFLLTSILLLSISSALNLYRSEFHGQLLHCSLDLVHCSTADPTAFTITRYIYDGNGGYNFVKTTSLTGCPFSSCTISANYMTDDGSKQLVYTYQSTVQKVLIYSHNAGDLTFIQQLTVNLWSYYFKWPTKITNAPVGDDFLTSSNQAETTQWFTWNNSSQQYDQTYSYNVPSTGFGFLVQTFEPQRKIIVGSYYQSSTLRVFYRITSTNQQYSLSTGNSAYAELVGHAVAPRGNKTAYIICYEESSKFNLRYYLMPQTGSGITLQQTIFSAYTTRKLRRIGLTRNGQYITILTSTGRIYIYQYSSSSDTYSSVYYFDEPSAFMDQFNYPFLSDNGSFFYRGGQLKGIMMMDTVLPLLNTSYSSLSSGYQMMACNLDMNYCSSVNPSTSEAVRYKYDGSSYISEGTITLTDCPPGSCTIIANYITDDNSKQLMYTNNQEILVYSYSNGSISLIQTITISDPLVSNSYTGQKMIYGPINENIFFTTTRGGLSGMKAYVYTFSGGQYTQSNSLNYGAFGAVSYTNYTQTLMINQEESTRLRMESRFFLAGNYNVKYFTSLAGAAMLDSAVSDFNILTAHILLYRTSSGSFKVSYFLMPPVGNTISQVQVILTTTDQLTTIYLTRNGRFLTVNSAVQGIMIYEYNPVNDQFSFMTNISITGSSSTSRAIISENGSNIYLGNRGSGGVYLDTSVTTPPGGGSSGGGSSSQSSSQSSEESSQKFIIIGAAAGGGILIILISIFVICRKKQTNISPTQTSLREGNSEYIINSGTKTNIQENYSPQKSKQWDVQNLE